MQGLNYVWTRGTAILAFAAACIVCGCGTLNMSPTTELERVDSPPDAPAEPLPVETEVPVEKPVPEIVYIEKPVYIPAKDAAAPQTPPQTGVESVRASTTEGTIAPSEYSHAARVYDFNDDQVFEVYTQILRATDICLEAGELVVEVPFISDSERWVLGAGVNQRGEQTIQHIYIKPKAAGLEATMIINTDRRVYHILLRSFNTVYMPIVRWNYKTGFVPFHFAAKETQPVESDKANRIEYVDPRFLSFDYTVNYSGLRKFPWIPRLVYDDGKKTYIVFPEQVLQQELPGVFENSSDIINYRVHGELVVIDKLIEKITVKYKNESITITKKRGS